MLSKRSLHPDPDFSSCMYLSYKINIGGLNFIKKHVFSNFFIKFTLDKGRNEVYHRRWRKAMNLDKLRKDIKSGSLDLSYIKNIDILYGKLTYPNERCCFLSIFETLRLGNRCVPSCMEGCSLSCTSTCSTGEQTVA